MVALYVCVRACVRDVELLELWLLFNGMASDFVAMATLTPSPPTTARL